MAIEQGLSSSLYTELALNLCSSLQQLCSLQSCVSRPRGSDDVEAFQLEMRSLLRELGCPHQCLMDGVDVMGDYHKRLLLVDFLLSELMAARLVEINTEEKMDTGKEV